MLAAITGAGCEATETVQRRRNVSQVKARIGAGRFHLLPIGGFFVGVGGFSLLIFMVGAAGIEPATPAV
jgi:hypothetical protein